MAYEKVKYNNDYNKSNYERLNILVKKGMKGYIEQRAKENYNSINQYVNALINIDLESNDYIKNFSGEEQFILNQYKYGTEEARKLIFDAALKADSLNENANKQKVFNKIINTNQ